MLGVDAISFFLFLFVVAAFVYKERKHIKFYGFMLMRRTQRGRGFIERLAKPEKFWNRFSIIGVAVGFAGMAFVSYTFITSLYNILVSIVKGAVVETPGYFIFPTYATETSIIPGAIFIPWFRWLVAISLIVIPHEFFHGILARANNIKIKSLGWALFLFFIPVAFVEPDENQLKKAKMSTKLRVFSAGSFANFLVAILFILIFLGFQSVIVSGVNYSTDQGLIRASGVYFGGYFKDGKTYPAEIAEVSGALMRIGDYEIRSAEDISDALSSHKPGDRVEVATSEGVYQVILAQSPDDPDRAFLGISSPYRVYYTSLGSAGSLALGLLEFSVELLEIIYLVFLFSFFIGLVNLLPVVPLDGGLMLKAVRDNYSGNLRRLCDFIIYSMSAVAVAIFGIIFLTLVSSVMV